MNIEKIKYFIDLVECGNFTYTAQRNFVSQTTITQQIHSLEKEFGVQLIDRKHNPVKATESGMLFYKEALVLWKQYTLMKSKMNNFVSEQKLVVKIEYTNMTDVKVLLDFIPEIKSNNSNINFEINKVKLKNVYEYLRKGLYDVAICSDSEFLDKDDIETIVIEQGEYMAVVNNTHPLCSLKEIPLEELYKHPIIMLDETAIGSSYSKMIINAKQDGYEPNIVRTTDDLESELFYIMTENLVGFLPDNHTIDAKFNTLKLIPIQNSNHKYKVVLAKLKENENPVLTFLADRILENIKLK